jgi:hypothetical protein
VRSTRTITVHLQAEPVPQPSEPIGWMKNLQAQPELKITVHCPLFTVHCPLQAQPEPKECAQEGHLAKTPPEPIGRSLKIVRSTRTVTVP